eukprot:gnl/TRDRNA2_/TRDRNA2_193167_c0_seq1.p1 gnl/TRDRNA2_/TRDRNA2_193167_c0~~gnl/TRDRNA2_/TRDRNA2_193167_c0_seq1.p1  ORF type:complete len:287 (-),score=75.16 gnl/TRDRNA2_/TRDRNA2_193167_c0_seq1:102-962(-)
MLSFEALLMLSTVLTVLGANRDHAGLGACSDETSLLQVKAEGVPDPVRSAILSETENAAAVKARAEQYVASTMTRRMQEELGKEQLKLHEGVQQSAAEIRRKVSIIRGGLEKDYALKLATINEREKAELEASYDQENQEQHEINLEQDRKLKANKRDEKAQEAAAYAAFLRDKMIIEKAESAAHAATKVTATRAIQGMEEQAEEDKAALVMGAQAAHLASENRAVARQTSAIVQRIDANEQLAKAHAEINHQKQIVSATAQQALENTDRSVSLDDMLYGMHAQGLV